MKGLGGVPLGLFGFLGLLVLTLTIKKDFPPVKEESKGIINERC
jgi:hypothetical protein